MARSLTGGILAFGGVALAAAVAVSTPRLTIRTNLTAARDARVFRSTVTPKPGWRGPYTFVAVEDATGQRDTIVHQQAAVLFVDTIFTPYPTCAVYRVTVYPAVATRARDSLTAKAALCRPYTIAEAAFVDSFPSSGRRINTCGAWAWKFNLDTLLQERLSTARTAADSATARQEVDGARRRPDSIPLTRTWGKGDTVRAEVGFTYPIGMFAKNRYTNAVRVLDGAASCAATASEYEAAPEGRTP